MSSPITPPVQQDVVTIYDPFGVTLDALEWLPGLYGTGASGGKWGAYHELRRCGCGVASMTGFSAPFTLQWAARFPLPGTHQSVPRAELYAIYMLVTRVKYGVLKVVSDSFVNVDMYHKGKLAALKSVNSDLWKAVFAHVEVMNIRLQIYWVPGHLDTKVIKSRVRVEDIFFALNFCADKFADQAAHESQLEMNPVSSLMFNCTLVKKIQRRSTRILVSHVEKHKYDKKFPLQSEAKPTLQHFVQASSHNL